MDDSKVAIVTGASRGIGRRVALGLCSDGYRVIAVARSREQLESLAKEAEEFSAAGGGIDIAVGDVTELHFVEQTVNGILANYNDIDVVFNNAGVSLPGTVDMRMESFNKLFDVNLYGAYHILRSVVGPMKRRGKGHIFNVSSVAGKRGFAGRGAYCATKFALMGLNEALFNECVPHGVKVTALCPSWVNTEMASYASIPPHEMIETADLYKTIRFLLSLSPNACVKELEIVCKATV